MSGAGLLDRIRSDRRAPLFALAAGTLILVTISAWFWYTHRRGYPMLTDEGLYTSLSLDDGRVLYQEGLGGLIDFYRAQVRTAPLVPLLTLPAQAVFGPSLAGGFVTILALYGALILASYAVARRLMSPWWSVFAALMVGVTPEIIQWGRMFYFAVPAAAFFIAGIACLLWSDGSRKWVWTVLGGVALGLAVLSRTMMLGFVIGPAVAALVQALAMRTELRRRLVNLAAGAVAGLLVASTWYWGHLGEVTDYLTDRSSRITGSVRTGKSIGRGFREVNQLVDTLYLPLAILIAVCVVVWAIVAWRGHRAASAEPEREAEEHALPEPWWLTVLVSDALFLVIVLVQGFALLVWADNSLAQWMPVVPIVVLLGVAAVAALPAGVVRTALAVALAGVGVFNLAMMNDVASTFGEPRLVRVGPFGQVTITDGRQVLQAQFERRGDDVGPPGLFPPSYREFAPQQRELAGFLRDYAEARGESPVVFAHIDDVHPLFTIVDLRMADQLNLGGGFPVGLVVPKGRDTVESIRAALNDPVTGVPNFVITTPVDGEAGAPADVGPVETALEEEGYEAVAERRLPDGTLVRVWWRPITEADLEVR